MDSNPSDAATNQREDFVDSMLKARLRMLQPMIVPYYVESFVHAGFSQEQLPAWPKDEPIKLDMQPLVTALISRLVEIACRPPDDVHDSIQASNPSEMALLTASKCSPLYASLALDSSRKNIRLLTILPGAGPQISCSLEVASLQDPGPYDALSYVWGPPMPTETITVNGATADIGRNLYVALLALRLPDQPRRLWADAICINQQDNQEKSWQVAIMAEIYRHADTVRVFVGDERDTAPLFRFLNRDASSDQDEDVAELAERCGIPILDLLLAYVDFSLRPWFSRIWVYQEFFLASKSPVWHCGAFSVANDLLKRDLEMLYTRCIEYQTPFTGDVDYNFARDLEYEDFISKLNDVTLMVFLPSQVSLFRSFPRMEYKRRRRISTDPRDLVFGLREFFEPAFQRVFQSDYTLDLNTVFIRLSAWLLVMDQWGDVFEAYPNRLSPDLPSWVRDFTPLPSLPSTSKNDEGERYLQCAIYNQVLAADGVELDEVAYVFPIDEDDISELVGKLWHLDWLFARMRAGLIQHTSILSPLDNVDSMYCWAMNHTNGELTQFIPAVMVVTRLSQSIIGPHIHDTYQQYEQIEDPSDYELQYMPKSEAIAYINSVSTERSRLIKRTIELQNLLTFILKSTMEDENIAAASLYDYESFVRQIKTFVDGSSSSGLASSASSPVDGENKILAYGPGTITYIKTLQFLSEESSPDVARFLLDVSQALHTGKLADQEIWDLVAPDFQQQLNRERERIDVWQRKAVLSLPSSSTENKAPAVSDDLSPPQDPTAGQDDRLITAAANLIASCIENRNQLDRLGESTAEVTKFTNSREEIAKALGEHSVLPFRHRTFFVTRGGLPGVGTIGVRGVQPSDKLIWLNNMRHPLVVRRATRVPNQCADGNEYYEIIGTAVVRGIMGGRLRTGLGDNMPPLRKFMFV